MKIAKSPFIKELFICENLRDPKTDMLGCCGLKGGAEIATRLKKMTADSGLKYKIRINRSGCLGDCANGIVISIYPGNIRLTHVTIDDIDQIFKDYILKDEKHVAEKIA